MKLKDLIPRDAWDLVQLGRKLRPVEVVLSGSPKKMLRYLKNRLVAKALYKVGSKLYRL